MNLLKRENWLVCLLLTFISQGIFAFILGKFLNVYKPDAWYRKWQYWVFGGLCLVFPIFIMILVFIIQIQCSVAEKLEVPGSKIYNSPYIWIILFIIPILGWSLLIIMLIYIEIWPIIMLKKGIGEKHLN